MAKALTATVPPVFLQFLANFFTDPVFRFKVLFQEKTSMHGAKLLGGQIQAIENLNLDQIVDELKKEIATWGDLAVLKGQVQNVNPNRCPDSAVTLAEESMYAEGKTFILQYPATLPASGGTATEVAGLGFDQSLKICFRLCPAGPDVVISPTSVVVGNDLYQHAKFTSPALTAGTWLILGSNLETPMPSDFANDTLQPGLVTVP